MPDIDPAALTRTESYSHPLAPPPLTTKLGGLTASTSQKSAKATNAAQRVDLEPLYTSLKAAIGDYWNEYKDAISLFMLGQLNQSELCYRIDYFLTVDPSTEHLHNQFIAAIFANVPRDLPDPGVAPWVSANEKPTILSKPVSGDAAEQRLKTEVMKLHARDRRRLKEVQDNDGGEPQITLLTEYHLAKQFRTSEAVPASAGGFNKTNWDLEIRKRYSQPLASETGEFPDAETIQGRMVPICYEESLVGGCATSCASFLATATEHFIKETLSSIYSRTRSNMPGGSVNGVMTHRYKRNLRREEEAFEKGDLVRAPVTGLLPVEMKESANRKPLGTHDLRLALELGDCGLGQFPMVVGKVMNGYREGELEAYQARSVANELRVKKEAVIKKKREDLIRSLAVNSNGSNVTCDDEPSVDDDEDLGWEGGNATDRLHLGSLLDDCLAIGQ